MGLWHEEENDVPNKMPLDVVISKSCDKDSSKQGTDEVVSNSSSGKEERNTRNLGKEAPKEEVVDLEKHLLACRSSLVHRKLRPCFNQSSLSSFQRDPIPSTSTPAAENQPSINQPPSLGLRAHLTLGCTEGVRPMQTGLDQVLNHNFY